MAATKTLLEGRNLLRYLLSSPDTGGHWSDDELNLYLDKAQKDVAIRLPDELVFDLAGTNLWLINGLGSVSLPSNYLRYVTTYRYLTTAPNTWSQVDKVSLDEFTRIKTSLSFASSGVSHTYIAEFGGILYIHPNGTTNETLTLKYIKVPDELTDNTDLFDVDDIVYEWVIYYAAFLACLKDSQGEKATGFINHLNNQIVETSTLFQVKKPPIFKYPNLVAQAK